MLGDDSLYFVSLGFWDLGCLIFGMCIFEVLCIVLCSLLLGNC